MAKKLFIGNLSWDTNDASLQSFFASAGSVVSARVITDRNTGRSRGFGFVEYATDEEAQKAIQELNGKDLDGRAIVVNEAREREENNDRFSRGDNRGGNRDDRRSHGRGRNQY